MSRSGSSRGCLLILPPFSRLRRPGADDPDLPLCLGVYHDEQPEPMRHAEDDQPLFAYRVVRGLYQATRAGEHTFRSSRTSYPHSHRMANQRRSCCVRLRRSARAFCIDKLGFELVEDVYLPQLGQAAARSQTA